MDDAADDDNGLRRFGLLWNNHGADVEGAPRPLPRGHVCDSRASNMEL